MPLGFCERSTAVTDEAEDDTMRRSVEGLEARGGRFDGVRRARLEDRLDMVEFEMTESERCLSRSG